METDRKALAFMQLRAALTPEEWIVIHESVRDAARGLLRGSKFELAATNIDAMMDSVAKEPF